MANETCPPDPIGGGTQQDLNQPATPGPTGPLTQTTNLESIRSLCQHGMSPAISVGVVMQLLRGHFANPAQIMEPALKQYVWSPNGVDSAIRIVPNTLFDPTQSGKLPALIVKRGPFSSERKSIGDRSESIDPTDAERGVQGYVRFHSGSVKVFCIAETSGEAELLALEVFDALSFLAPVLVERLPFHDFQVTGLGEQGVLEGQGNRIGIPVVAEFKYEYGWEVKPLGPRLRSLDIQAE